MKTAVIVHGTCDQEEYFSDKYPSLSNSHWIPWLQKQLLIQGYFTQTPEMPNAYLPEYAKWKSAIERFTIINTESILIGHSCGGGFLLRWLSENPQPIKRLVLVAPFLDPERRMRPNFFNFKIDGNLARRADIHLVVSDNDTTDIVTSAEIICSSLSDVTRHLFKGYGHFCFSDLGKVEFPELRLIAIEGGRQGRL